MKKLFLLFLLSLFLSFPNVVYAEYVMPYPGIMPGNKLYEVSQAFDAIEGWWSFGNLAQFSYQLKMADKKLIEAKTLFEYKQYLLGYQALQASDMYFSKTINSLEKAKKEKKDIEEKQTLLISAAEKHTDILNAIISQTPATIEWKPEKQPATMIDLGDALRRSINLRAKVL